MIVTNATYTLAPFADALFGMDADFWRAYGPDIERTGFAGERWTCGEVFGVQRIDRAGIKNSGAGAILAACIWGASRVVLLGFDGQRTAGRAHWHADHPRGLGNAGSVGKWPAQFRDLATLLKGSAVIVNASRETALDAFPRVPLREALS